MKPSKFPTKKEPRFDAFCFVTIKNILGVLQSLDA